MSDRAERRLANFERWRSRILLVTFLLLVLGVLWFRAVFEFVSVPQGMDTLPRTHPAGALCLVVKRPTSAAVGDVVFVDVPGGGTLLAKVVRVAADGFHVAATDPRSTLTGGKEIGPLALAALRGRVAAVFGGEEDPDARK